MGVATPDERQELEALLPKYIDLQVALSVIEQQFEQYALQQAIPPPTQSRKRYHDFIERMPVPTTKGNGHDSTHGKKRDRDGYISIEVTDPYIRVHKHWRTFFFILAVLFKLLVLALIYMCFKYFEMRSEVRELKHKINQVQIGRR